MYTSPFSLQLLSVRTKEYILLRNYKGGLKNVNVIKFSRKDHMQLKCMHDYKNSGHCNFIIDSPISSEDLGMS